MCDYRPRLRTGSMKGSLNEVPMKTDVAGMNGGR